MNPKIILHIFSGDLWAGAEVMILNLLCEQKKSDELSIIALSLNEGVLTKKLREVGIETYVIPESRIPLFIIVARAFKLLRNKKISVIHSHRYKENLIGFILAKLIRSKVLISTYHGLPEISQKSKDNKINISRIIKLDNYLLNKYFTAVVAVSHEIKSFLENSFNINENKIKVIHNGIPIKNESASNINVKRDVIRIGSVGRLVEIKNYELFIDAANLISANRKEVLFTILGDGPLKSKLVNKIENLGLKDIVKIVNVKDDPEPYYLTLDVYVNTSHHEGIPLSVLEAMSYQLPVVAPNVGGLPEIVESEVNGILYKKGDLTSLCNACEELIGNSNKRKSIGLKAKERVVSAFNVTSMAASYNKMYKCI